MIDYAIAAFDQGYIVTLMFPCLPRPSIAAQLATAQQLLKVCLSSVFKPERFPSLPAAQLDRLRVFACQRVHRSKHRSVLRSRSLKMKVVRRVGRPVDRNGERILGPADTG